MFCECYARARERGRAEKCRALDSGGAAIVCAIQYSEQKTLNRMPGRPSDLSSFKYLYIFRVAYSFRSVHFSPSSFFFNRCLCCCCFCCFPPANWHGYMDAFPYLEMKTDSINMRIRNVSHCIRKCTQAWIVTLMNPICHCRRGAPRIERTEKWIPNTRMERYLCSLR